jgi:hypothetical protein
LFQARLRAGHHPQLRAAWRRNHAADRPRDRARYGWRESFIVLGAASLVWTAVWLATFRDTPEEHPWVTGVELELTNAVLWTLPLDIAGQFAGTAGGMMNAGFGVASMISPVVFGVLIERTGRYELPLFISAALLLVGALCSLRIDPTLNVQTLPSA